MDAQIAISDFYGAVKTAVLLCLNNSELYS